jgi:hypothetical protein
MRGVDFDTRLIEFILNIFVQFGIDFLHIFRMSRKYVQFIGHVEIVKTVLQHKRLGVWEDLLCGQCCTDQQIVDDPPGNAVANRVTR